MPKRYYINQYRLSRAYGGPEEGGWWYDTGEFIYSVPDRLYDVTSLDAATVLRNRLQEQINAEQDTGPDKYLYDLNSVCCRGRIEYLLQLKPGANFPAERPYYC